MELKDEQTIVSLLDKDPELKKIYTEIKELQLQVAFTDAEKSTSKSSDLIIE